MIWPYHVNTPNYTLDLKLFIGNVMKRLNYKLVPVFIYFIVALNSVSVASCLLSFKNNKKKAAYYGT